MPNSTVLANRQQVTTVFHSANSEMLVQSGPTGAGTRARSRHFCSDTVESCRCRQTMLFVPGRDYWKITPRCRDDEVPAGSCRFGGMNPPRERVYAGENPRLTGITEKERGQPAEGGRTGEKQVTERRESTGPNQGTQVAGTPHRSRKRTRPEREQHGRETGTRGAGARRACCRTGGPCAATCRQGPGQAAGTSSGSRALSAS
jgi:hypothetical protein